MGYWLQIQNTSVICSCLKEMFYWFNDNKATELKQIQEMSAVFVKDIIPIRNAAMRTYYKWSGRNDFDASGLLVVLSKYAKYRYILKHSCLSMEEIVPTEELQDFCALENYRDKGIKFWYDFSRIEFTYHSLYKQPNVGEMMEFSTFHWAIYMVNNKSAETPGNEGPEPFTYSLVLTLLKRFVPKDVVQEKLQHIYTFRNAISVEFVNMQQTS